MAGEPSAEGSADALVPLLSQAHRDLPAIHARARHIKFFQTIQHLLRKDENRKILHKIYANSTLERYRKKDLLFQSNKVQAQTPSVILKGTVAMLSSKNGKPVTHGICFKEGDMISKEVIMWLEPNALALIAQGSLLVLQLPLDVYSQCIKVNFLQHLIRHSELLSQIPTLRNCPEGTLRGLAMAGSSILLPAKDHLAIQRDACSGLILLVSGTVAVSVDANDEIVDGEKSAVATGRVIAHVSAPELVGLIDLIRPLCALGRNITNGVSCDTIEFLPTYGVTVRCTTQVEGLFIPTESVLELLAGTPSFAKLAATAAERGIVRDALKSEVKRQAIQEVSTLRFKDASSIDPVENNSPPGTKIIERVNQGGAKSTTPSSFSKNPRVSSCDLARSRSTTHLPRSPERPVLLQSHRP